MTMLSFVYVLTAGALSLTLSAGSGGRADVQYRAPTPAPHATARGSFTVEVEPGIYTFPALRPGRSSRCFHYRVTEQFVAEDRCVHVFLTAHEAQAWCSGDTIAIFDPRHQVVYPKVWLAPPGARTFACRSEAQAYVNHTHDPTSFTH